MTQTTLPISPRRGSDMQQQIWTVWTMLRFFVNSVYDPFAAGITAVSGDKTFVYNQLSPANSWLVAHNLNKYPAVTVVDNGGNVLIPDIDYIDNNHVTINFSAATSGAVYCN